ncbi:MAG: isopenicillin-N epimerase [Nocardioidaceae bacterium]|nr:isopenicillin-N epimerase [Nocardioidaceae bacterium]
MNPLAAQFPLTPGLVMLNHASFGLGTRRVLQEAAELRQDLESDPNRHLGPELLDRLRAVTRRLAATFGLPPAATTMTANATTGASALMRSLPLEADQTVAVLASEYSSVQRGWELRCREVGARFRLLDVPQPLESADELVARLDAQIAGRVAVVQLSLVSSTAALLLPVRQLCEWGRSRGARVVLDAAHGPGHVPLRVDDWDVDAVYGTLHKWLPTPRPLGFLSLTPELTEVVRPAEVSLSWDSPDLVERFSWPGTYDPVPRLLLPSALERWDAWSRAGAIAAAESLADRAAVALTRVGAVPTAGTGFLPPRLRAFLLPGVRRDDLDRECAAAHVRAWTGLDPGGVTVLRLAFHVYNDDDDVHAVVTLVERLLSTARSRDSPRRVT